VGAVLHRLRTRAREEDGLTLVELLVAAAMSVVLMAAVTSMVIGAMRAEPEISKRAQSITSARYVLERMTREIRNGIRIDKATATSVSFLTYVRRTSCGGSTPSTTSIKCEVTYTCTSTACSRVEAADGVYTGTAQTIYNGLGSSEVFCYVPSTNSDSLTCGPALSVASSTYVGVKLKLPNPTGAGSFSVSDGASLRNAVLLK
jgi:Tfp pilus assembly protein PilW